MPPTWISSVNVENPVTWRSVAPIPPLTSKVKSWLGRTNTDIFGRSICQNDICCYF